MKEEIQKQLNVGFLSMVKYPEWLVNVVLVPKKDNKVRVYVDFRYLNKASPNDDFPLPHIDMLVDSTTGHSMLSFMNGFSGVMPFGLKNVEATYQRAATTLFNDMMHRDVECTFGVTSEKLLGYMVSERGIEADPDKIRATLNMPAPRTEREVRGFLGRLQYISIFIVKLIDIFSDVALGCMLAQLDDSVSETCVYPEVAMAKDKRALKQLATRFVICGETLYRRSADGMLLLCLDRASTDRVIYTEDLIHVPPLELHALTSPWSFSVWVSTSLGGFRRSLSSSGHEFILVTIDYFTKWVEVASYARLTSSRVASFIISHIICRYGVPHELIFDREVHFRADVDTLLHRYGATPYSLAYGMEAVLPVEIEMGSLRVALEQ
ncbi:hypothetical protein CK203_078043 [Vitis vinifera]|uniref:Integrase catalytic domain-containing protein n=1 Tax=Vitis vinifera TaxID=29760 RepID=A0A438DHN3_VITVI|nr:hypothetical protein CK203_078043 [Vitis vinifera]